jgi:hypothetical protein
VQLGAWACLKRTRPLQESLSQIWPMMGSFFRKEKEGSTEGRIPPTRLMKSPARKNPCRVWGSFLRRRGSAMRSRQRLETHLDRWRSLAGTREQDFFYRQLTFYRYPAVTLSTAVYRGIPLNTARIQISNQNRFLPLVQTV